MAVTFVNITESDFLKTKLFYKHMSLEDALRVLNTHSIWFSNPSEWNDPFEKRFLEAKYIKGDKEMPFSWVDRVFCTCFTQTASSEAFWHAYSSESICIEFRFIKEKLLEELRRISEYDVYIGRAEYLYSKDLKKTRIKEIPFNPPIDRVMSPLTAARLFMLKRVAFQYEDEIRILLVDNSTSQKKGVPIRYECSNNELIYQVLLDPRLESETSNLLKEVFENKYGFRPTESGGKRVIQSSLYQREKPAVISLD